MTLTALCYTFYIDQKLIIYFLAIFYSLVNIATMELRNLMREPSFKCFDFDKPEGKRLVAILLDLVKCDDNSLCLSSYKFLFDIYQVY